MGKERSWNVSSLHETRSQVKHCTEDSSLPSKTSLIIDLGPDPFVVWDVLDLSVDLWSIGWLVSFCLGSSNRLDGSETPLSQVSYSASDWEGEIEEQIDWPSAETEYINKLAFCTGD